MSVLIFKERHKKAHSERGGAPVNAASLAWCAETNQAVQPAFGTSSNCRYVRERLRPRSGLGLADQGSQLILLGVPQDTEQVCEGQVRVLLGGCPSGRKFRMASARCCSSSNSSGCQAVPRSLAGPSARVGERRERNVEAVTAERGEMQN